LTVKTRTKRKTTAVQPDKGGSSILVWLGVRSARTALLYIGLAIVLSSGLSVVRTTHANRFAFNELQQLKDEANRLDVQWGQLLLEQSTFGLDGRIEQKAVEQLQMQVPDIDDIVMVQHD
jgi:cell division protein FtsL